MVSNKRLIVVYIEQARIPNETTSITRSEIPITGDIVIHHRVQNGANNKVMGDGFLKELYDILDGTVSENLKFEDEEKPDMDMMDFDIPAPPEPDIVDVPTLEQEPSMQDNAPEMPAKKTNAFGTLKAAATEPKVEPHESAKPVESYSTQPRPQKPDVPQTPKAEPKAEPVAPAQRPKADREAALAGFNITRKVEPSKEVKKPKKPITDKRTSTSKSSPKEDSAKAPKQKQPSKEAPAKSQKKPANEKQQNSDEPKKVQPFDQSFRKRGRGSSKKAQQSNGQISFEELH